MLFRAYFARPGRGRAAPRDRHPRHRARHEPGERDDGRLRARRRSRPTRAATSTSRTCAARSAPQTAGLMLTNPSTLGLFDENIEEIERIFHGAGALMYYDGANLNAVCGISRPGDMGFDVVHINLHKTFSQPHGGGGPGGGPIAVTEALEPFLPVPAVVQTRGRDLRPRLRPAEVDRQGARVHRPVRRLRPLVRVHPHVRAAAARDVRGRGAERELPARAPEGRVRPAVRPAVHARVRALRARR